MLHQPGERALRIDIVEQRTMARMTGAGDLLVQGGLQIHHRAAFGQQAPVLRIEHRAAAGREHDPVEQRQPLDRLLFAGTESGLAFLFEDERDVDAGPVLDVGIAVMERKVQQPRELAPDGALSRAHRTDQIDVLLGNHRGWRSVSHTAARRIIGRAAAPAPQGPAFRLNTGSILRAESSA